jgi:hypothetical protein
VSNTNRARSDLRTIAADPLCTPANIAACGVDGQGTTEKIRMLLGHQHSFTQLDLSTGVRSDTWTAEFFVKNVTDTRGDLYRFAECTTQVCGNEHYQVPIVPRMFGIRFGQRFD